MYPYRAISSLYLLTLFLSFTYFIYSPCLGESISSETSNGCLNEAEVTWQAFDEEADTQSTQSAHMDVTADPQSQGSLLLSHNEALAGIRADKHSTLSSRNRFLLCGIIQDVFLSIDEL